jgi:MFS family permease
MKQVIPALGALLAVQSLICLAGAAPAVLVPLAAADLGFNPQLIGIFTAAMYAVAAISCLICGGIISILGPLRTSQVAVVSSALGALALTLGMPAAFLAAIVLLGAAYGPSQPAATMLLMRLTPPGWTNIVFSIRQTGVPLGIGLAGVILPPLGLWLGWRGALVVTAILTATTALALQPLRARLDAGTAPTAPFRFANLARPLRLMWAKPTLRRLAVLGFAYSSMQTILGTFLVIYLHTDIVLSLVTAGAVLSVTYGVGVPGRIFWGVVADRWVRPRRVLGGVGIAMSVFAAITASFTPEWPLVVVMTVTALYGFTAVSWNGVFVGQLAQQAPREHVSEVAGAGAFCAFAGVAAGPAVFSAVLGATGSYAAGFAVFAGLTYAIGVWLLASRDEVDA